MGCATLATARRRAVVPQPRVDGFVPVFVRLFTEYILARPRLLGSWLPGTWHNALATIIWQESEVRALFTKPLVLQVLVIPDALFSYVNFARLFP